MSADHRALYWSCAFISTVILVVLWEWFLLGYKFGVPRTDDINFYYWSARQMEAGGNWLEIFRQAHGPHMSIQNKILSFSLLQWFGYDMRWYIVAGPMLAAVWAIIFLIYAKNNGSYWFYVPAIVFLTAPPAIFRSLDYNMLALDGSLGFVGIYMVFFFFEKWINNGKWIGLLLSSLYLVFLYSTTAYQIVFASCVVAGSLVLGAKVSGIQMQGDLRVMLKRLALTVVSFLALHVLYVMAAIDRSPPPGPLTLDPIVLTQALLNGFYLTMGGGMLNPYFPNWSPWQIGIIGAVIFVGVGLICLPTLIKKRALFVLAVVAFPFISMAGTVLLRGESATLFPRYSHLFATFWPALALAVAMFAREREAKTWIKCGVSAALCLVIAINVATIRPLLAYRASAANAERAANDLLLRDDISGDFNPALLQCRRTLDQCREAILDIRARRLGVSAERAVSGS